MDAYLQPVRRAAFGVLGIALIACGPWLGWWTLLPLAMAVVAFRVADTKIPTTKRPEYAILTAWLASQVIMAASIALSGGPKVATLSWLAIPVLTLGSRFSLRGIAVGVAFTLILMCAVAFGVDAQAVIDSPPRLIAPAALVICVAMFQTVLMRSDVKYRAQAVIDPLTGMLNRKSLDQRGAELEQQSRITEQPVGLVIGDIDHFKRINDTCGHAVGDAVLKDVAYEMRKQLRAFDLFYRIGGEEFLVLLPGADLGRAATLAEELRTGIAAEPRGGQRVTLSFGVAASEPGAGFEYEAVFAEADSRLYEAKRSGRNRVCPPVAAPALAPA